MENKLIRVTTIVDAPIEKVWDNYVRPEHIVHWNYATDEWHCPKASCDFKPGGNFSFRMAAKNGEHQFDLKGTYINIRPQEFLSYALEDHREVQVTFENTSNGISIEQTFEPESSNPHEMQRKGPHIRLPDDSQRSKQSLVLYDKNVRTQITIGQVASPGRVVWISRDYCTVYRCS